MALTFAARSTLLLALPLTLLPAQLLAQDSQPPTTSDEDDTIVVEGTKAQESYTYSAPIIVTAAVRQGGAQDVKHFRSISLDSLGSPLPKADSLTLEGLLGEHDLTLPSSDSCDQLFCISAHAMAADIPARAGDAHFVGIGFASAIDAEAYRREPVSLIAVVDRSGSMGGEPIDRVKEGLHAALDAMREGDRLGIVIYGSETLVHQEVIDVAGNREELHRAIDGITIHGSTYMEAGLRLGYATAIEELAHSRGKTRLMLFTDENPNVGDTSAEGFMGQAISGSRKGVGLITIGVARHFDAALATKVSSVRGGNLFFLPEEGSGEELFASEFTNMISEVAQDLVIAIDPAPGLQVTGVFGVPGEIIDETASGTVTVTVGSAFLSSNGGGIYASFSGAAERGETIADISVSYTDAISQRRESDSAAVTFEGGKVPANLAKAQMLVEQYFTMTEALASFHDDGDALAAAETLAGLSSRMKSADLPDMGGEITLVSNLLSSAERFAGISTSGRTQPWQVVGEWEVMRLRGVEDLARGDLVEITEDGDFFTERMSGPHAGDWEDQTFAINERKMHIEGAELFLQYRVHGDRLKLRDPLDGTEIVMRRVVES